MKMKKRIQAEATPKPNKSRKKRIFVGTFLVLVLLGLVYLLIDLHIQLFSSKYILDADALDTIGTVDCIVVPGARVRQDGSPSLMLQSRLDAAIALYEKGVSDKLLLSGDHGRTEYDEVNHMMSYVLAHSDLTAESVFLDHAGFSTYETAYRMNVIFECKRCVCVTQKYHLYRLIYTARKQGVEAYGVVCDDREWPGMPYYRLRESVAIVKDFFKCLFGVRPTYLGEPVPVSGTAYASHDLPDELPNKTIESNPIEITGNQD